jgi:hypothetical protein
VTRAQRRKRRSNADDGDAVRATFSTSGQLVTTPFSPRDLDFTANVAVTTATQTAIRAAQAAGIRSAGISIPLGNYHNINDARQIAPEFVMMDDLKSLITLLKALVATKHDGIGERTIRERVELRMAEHAEHLKAGTKLFK